MCARASAFWFAATASSRSMQLEHAERTDGEARGNRTKSNMNARTMQLHYPSTRCAKSDRVVWFRFVSTDTVSTSSVVAFCSILGLDPGM